MSRIGFGLIGFGPNRSFRSILVDWIRNLFQNSELDRVGRVGRVLSLSEFWCEFEHLYVLMAEFEYLAKYIEFLNTEPINLDV